MRRVTWLSVLVLLIAGAVLAACGGSDKAPGGSDASSGKPPAAAVEPTATPSALVFSAGFETLAPSEPITGVDAILGGTPNRRAAALVRDQLKAIGLDIPGLNVYVLPVTGTYEEILVVEIDATAAEAAGLTASTGAPQDDTAFFKALASLETSEIANVTRVVFNMRSTDEQGPVIMTMVVSMAVVADLALGIDSSEDLLKQMQFEIKRPGQQ